MTSSVENEKLSRLHDIFPASVSNPQSPGPVRKPSMVNQLLA